MLSGPPWQALSNICKDTHARAWVSLQADLLRAPNTVIAYARGLDHYLSFCGRGGIDVTSAGRAQIAGYVRELVQPHAIADGATGSATGLANASIRHRLTVVRLFYDHLVEEGVRTTNPVARGRRGAAFGGWGVGERGLIPVQRKLPSIPNEDEWRALLGAACSEPVRNRLMLAFAYDCALRREELCSLATGDIDPARRLLRVRAETTKTKRERVVPYSVVSADLYMAYLAERRRLGSLRGPLFLSESTRNRAAPMTKWTWSKVVRRLALRAAVPALTTHSFRHLCLTDLARAGWDIEEIASFAGHRSIQSTLLTAAAPRRCDMSMKTDAVAPANATPVELSAGWDRSSDLSASEHAALHVLGTHFANHQRQWPAGSREALTRLLSPLLTVLDRMHAAQAPRNAAVHILVAEIYRLNIAYWGWSGDQWLDVLCSSEAAFKDRYGGSSNCRQYVIAVAYLLCGFDRLAEIGRYFQYRLAIKVFGRDAVDHAVGVVFDEMTRVGLSAADRPDVSNALCMALLVQRSARLEDLTLSTLQHVALSAAAYVRSGAATLSRALARMHLLDQGLDHRRHDRRRPAGEYRAVDDVPAQWLHWCDRWRATSVRAASSIAGDYYALLKCGRWLATMHPEIEGPADWTRATALEYVAAVARMTIGQWSNPGSMYLDQRGCSLKPTAKAAHLRSIRSFFRDLQEWEWIPLRFDPVRALGLPRAIGASIGPNARVVADDAWAKLVWAGLSLTDEDLQPVPSREGCTRQPPRYPLAMVRAVAMLWLFAGLRRDELWRLPVGCIRWQPLAGDVVAAPTCLLDVPVNKTSTAFTKPVDALVGRAVEVWEQQRLPHPSMPDAKTGGVVDYLFVHRGRRVGLAYLNQAVIPLLCRKAGVPLEDARGRITSHRARATIASQLFNAREPLGLFELQAWLGHRSPEATRHYVTVTPTKLAGAIERAGYFARNLRTIAVLVDKDAVTSGSATRGEPWRYYDLGHGLCTYDFFDQCPHRMACAKCSFYMPKESSKAQALEASANLSRMLQEIPLLEGERAAVEDGIEAMTKLANSLRDTATPDGRTPVEIAVIGVSAK